MVLVKQPAASTPLLDAVALEGQRGERTLFRGLDLSLAAGELVWLRGRNGRGKTTLLRLLAGLAAPAAGVVRIAGQAQAALRRAVPSPLLYLAHTNALKDDLSALEALEFLASLGGPKPGRDALRAALGRLGVESRAGALVRTLSQGQRRRVALARLALPGAPQLWLLDEPFDALDAQGVETLQDLLAEQAARGGAVLFTSHQEPALQSVARARVFDLDACGVGA
jgi:heme exporter protein A